MSEEEENMGDWLGCPGSVKVQLPKKIEKAVNYALDKCFLDIVGTPEAQKDKWLYKEIEARICAAMKKWVEDAIDDAIGEVLEE